MTEKKETSPIKILVQEFDEYMKFINEQRAAEDEFLKNFLSDPKDKPVKKARGGPIKSNIDKPLFFDEAAKARILKRYKTIAIPKVKLSEGGRPKYSLKDLKERRDYLNSEINDLGSAVIYFPEMLEELGTLEKLIKRQEN